MEPFDPGAAPVATGLVNAGAACYFNALVQSLASCTALTRTVAAAANAALLEQTPTGSALRAYFHELRPGTDPTRGAERLLAAVVADLAVRRPGVRFGGGQESASEALVHLLDMLEPAALVGGSPITDLFMHRSACTVYCLACRQKVSRTLDSAVHVSLFHLDQMEPPATAIEFARALSRHVSAVDDYSCGKCGRRGRALRIYSLTMVPEILFCIFNLYGDYGGAHRARWFPERFGLPGLTPGEMLQYRLVAQIEHSGSMHGGHYWARCLRARGGQSSATPLQVFALNDLSVAPSAFTPTQYTYMIVYHFDGVRPGLEGEWDSLARGGRPPRPA